MTVQYGVTNGVGIATISNSEKKNALSPQIVSELLAILRRPRPECRALVFTGKGSVFCAGADVDALKKTRAGRGAEDTYPSPVDLFEALVSNDRICIAAVNGPAIGGGFELALSCDFVVAARESYFALPEVRLGVIPNAALALLPQNVGGRRTLEYVATAKRVTAEEALAAGVVARITDRERVVDEAVALARSVVIAAPPGCLAAVKAAVRTHSRIDWVEVRASLERLSAAESAEGLAAFLDKRKPNFDRFWDAW